jgi:subfamily B ATP-binding cassette protein MsbA
VKIFRRLFALTRPYRGGFLLGALSVLLGGLLYMLMILMIHPLLHDVVGFKKDKVSALEGWIARLHLQGIIITTPATVSGWVVILLLLLVLVKGVAEFFGEYYISKVGLRVVKDLRDQLFERTLAQGLRFYARHPSGNLISRVVSDCDKLQYAVSEKLAELAQHSSRALFLLVSLFFQNYRFAGTVLVLGPLIGWPLSRLSRRLRRTARRTQERTAEMSEVLKETITGARVVKAFGMEAVEGQRFRAITQNVFAGNLKVAVFIALTSPLMDFIGAGLAAGILFFAVRWTEAYRNDPSLLITFLASLFALYQPVKKLAQANNVIQVALASADRCFEVLDEPLEITEAPGAAPLPKLRDFIEFKSVSFGYAPGQLVLSDLNLQVRRGETVAIVGSSGAGKTTLVNLLPRFFDPDSGAVRFDGADIRGATVASLRAQIGVVSQEVILFNDTVAANISYGHPGAPPALIEAAARAAYAHEFVTAMPRGYDSVVGEAGAQLSGGQRQRLAIARAILKDPPILILDEATSALDAESEALVQKALANLMAGRTAFVIAHRLSTVRHADRIIVLDAGRIADEGSHAELLARPGVYRRLHELQYFQADEALAEPA